MIVGEMIYVPDGIPDTEFGFIGYLKGGYTKVDRVIISQDITYFYVQHHGNFKTYKEHEILPLQDDLKKQYGYCSAYISQKK